MSAPKHPPTLMFLLRRFRRFVWVAALFGAAVFVGWMAL